MALLFRLSAFWVLLVSFVAALETARQVDVYAWPLSASNAQLFARVEYNSTSAKTSNVQKPQLSAEETLVRIGHYQEGTKKWSGIVTSKDNFATGKEQVVLVHLDDAGMAYHIGLRTTDAKSKDVSVGQVSAEVVPLHPAPVVHFNKPVVLAADGQVEGPPEKSFLQKYWWAIAIFLVLQVVMGGGADKK